MRSTGAFRQAIDQFYTRLEEAAQRGTDAAASSVLDPANRWNPLLDAMGTYISGAELEQVSLKDLDNYHSTDINWRVVEGYGTLIATYGANVPAMLDCPVSGVDRSGKRLRNKTSKGCDHRRSGRCDGAERDRGGRAHPVHAGTSR